MVFRCRIKLAFALPHREVAKPNETVCEMSQVIIITFHSQKSITKNVSTSKTTVTENSRSRNGLQPGVAVGTSSPGECGAFFCIDQGLWGQTGPQEPLNLAMPLQLSTVKHWGIVLVHPSFCTSPAGESFCTSLPVSLPFHFIHKSALCCLLGF